MVSFSGLSAVYPGFLEAQNEEIANRYNKTKAIGAETDLAGQEAYGRTLMSLGIPGSVPMPATVFGGGQPGMPPGGPPQGPQAPMPGQASMPMARPMPQGMPGQQAMNMNLPTPYSDLQPMPQGGAMPIAPMQQAGMQQQGGGQQGIGLGPGGSLDWRAIAQKVAQANQGANPAVIAAAVDRFVPLMNAQSQQEWRMMSMQLRSQAEEGRNDRFDAREGRLADQFGTAEQGRNARAEMSAKTRGEIATMNIDARKELQSLAENGRMDRANMSDNTRRELAKMSDETKHEIADLYEAGRQDRFDTSEERKSTQFNAREERLKANALVRNDASMQRLELQKQEAARKASQGGDKLALSQWRAVVDAQNKRANEVIRANMMGKPTTEVQAVLDEQAKAYAEEISNMKAQMGAGKPYKEGGLAGVAGAIPVKATVKSIQDKLGDEQPTSTPAKEAAPAEQPVPEAYKNDPDGVKYRKDGKVWMKQGDKLVQVKANG